jgi:hypothetical protein
MLPKDVSTTARWRHAQQPAAIDAARLAPLVRSTEAATARLFPPEPDGLLRYDQEPGGGAGCSDCHG